MLFDMTAERDWLRKRLAESPTRAEYRPCSCSGVMGPLRRAPTPRGLATAEEAHAAIPEPASSERFRPREPSSRAEFSDIVTRPREPTDPRRARTLGDSSPNS